jgi:hypothetical protein
MTETAASIAGLAIPVWPEGLPVRSTPIELTAQVDFADHDRYATALLGAIMEREHDPRFADWIFWIFRGGCGMKGRDIQTCIVPEATLIHQRALALCHKVLSGRTVYVDSSWASVYREGDYCMPHSHLRAVASVLYMLDQGDPCPEDSMAGRFTFCDPRIPQCCPQEAGRMTHAFMPQLNAGSMLFFAADYVHSVNPYRGKRPRVTLSWNMTLEQRGGAPGAWAQPAE